MYSGIYTITNKLNGKIYIGYATNFKRRWAYHKRRLRNQTHDNEYLQAAWNKYGEEHFEFEKLLYCEDEFLSSEENYWANLLNVHNREYGYNIRPTSPDTTLRHCKETLDKIKRNRKKYIPTKETKLKISIANKGRKDSEDTKLRKSIANKGTKPSSITIQRGIEYNKTAIKSTEQLQRLSEIAKGKIKSEEVRSKIGAKNRNRSHNEQAKIKMRKPKLSGYIHIDQNGAIMEFKDYHELFDFFGISRSTLCKWLRGAIKSRQTKIYHKFDYQQETTSNNKSVVDI